MVPPYSASDWLTLMSFPHPTNLTPEAYLLYAAGNISILSIFRTECICICCKLWRDRVRRLFFCFVLREAAVAIAMKIVSFVITALVCYPLRVQQRMREVDVETAQVK